MKMPFVLALIQELVTILFKKCLVRWPLPLLPLLLLFADWPGALRFGKCACERKNTVECALHAGTSFRWSTWLRKVSPRNWYPALIFSAWTIRFLHSFISCFHILFFLPLFFSSLIYSSFTFLFPVILHPFLPGSFLFFHALFFIFHIIKLLIRILLSSVVSSSFHSSSTLFHSLSAVFFSLSLLPPFFVFSAIYVPTVQ
jgi:hypothetical protein